MERGTLEKLVFENQALLEQTSSLVGQFTAASYAHSHDALGCCSIGKHIRHIIGHYQALLRDQLLVDYDDRPRHTTVEFNPQAARQRLNEISKKLRLWAGEINDAMEPLLVSYAVGGEYQGNSVRLASSACRELAFVSSHTLHHMAIIGILARSIGIAPPENFGVAHSTQAFQLQQQKSDYFNKHVAAGR